MNVSGDNPTSDRVLSFDTTLRGWASSLRFRDTRTPSFDAINGLLYSLSSSLKRTFRRIVTSHHARISPTAKLAAFLSRRDRNILYCRQIAEMV